MQALIFTEGGKKIGFGHITRCRALYDALKEKDFNPKLIVKGDNSVLGALEGTRYEMFDWIFHVNKALEMILPEDVVIIDSYLAKLDVYNKISGAAQEAIFIDDNMRIKYPNGTILNGAIYAANIRYSKVNGYVNMLGPKYAILRKEFSRLTDKALSKKVHNIMITFGGEDRRNLTPKVATLIARLFPDTSIKVIIGNGFRNKKRIEKVCGNSAELIYRPDAGTMKRVMMGSDIAFSAGGQTLYELAIAGVPTVAVAVAENQLRNVIGWRKAGFIEYAGWWRDKSLMRKIKAAAYALSGHDARAEHSRVGRSIMDGKGCQRVAENILKNSISLRPATMSDAKDIWIWKNSRQARKSSFDGLRVSWRTHMKWFKSKMEDKKTRIYIAARGEDTIGVVRFDMDGKEATISVNLNPKFIGMGFGRRIIKIGSALALKNLPIKVINAEIKDSNIASVNAFVAAGYRYSGRNNRAKIYTLEERRHA